MRFASPIEPLRCAARASSNSCCGVECPTASFVLKRKLAASLALPIVRVLDIETRCSIKLHIDNWTGELNFVYRAWPLEQSPVILTAGGIDDGLTRRRRQRYNHSHRRC